jgi:peptide/nickel transport system permease protein
LETDTSSYKASIQQVEAASISQVLGFSEMPCTWHVIFCTNEVKLPVAMPPFIQFIFRRLFTAFVSLIAITMLLYAGVMLTPPEARARLYLPQGNNEGRASQALVQSVIEKHHLDEPYLIQYGYWVRSLLTGSWGYSPTLREYVLLALLRRTPVTLELALYSLLLLIPLGLVSGFIAGWQPYRRFDSIFRGLAYFGTSMPPFIFSMILLAVFYVRLGWFAPERMDVATELEMVRSGFVNYTGALTLDSLLNRRFDIFLLALRHLAMPIMTLSMFYWATLGRVTRAAVLGQRNQEYIIAARARGIAERRLMWRHALRAILAPTLTTMAISASGIVTSSFVVEIIFVLPGVSQVIVKAMRGLPDAPASLGFAVYSVMMVISLMFILDVLQAILDPRVRDEVLRG